MQLTFVVYENRSALVILLMHVLNVTELTLISESYTLKVEVKHLSLFDLRHKNQGSDVLELVMRLEIKKSKVDYKVRLEFLLSAAVG